MAKPTTMADLRSLVAAWTPAPVTRSGWVATGVPGIDSALGGGLPGGRITELVSSGPSCGGDLVLASLLASTRSARLRVALVDAADGFAPANHRPDLLRHLLWVRPRTLAEALMCADVLVRDGNFGVLVLDLRGVTARALRQQPSATWHRLRLAAEQHPAAVLVQSMGGVVPAVSWRLVLSAPVALGDLRLTREKRTAALAVEIERGHASTRAELAG